MNLINNTIINEAKFKRRIKLKFSITKPNPLLEKKLKKANTLNQSIREMQIYLMVKIKKNFLSKHDDGN